MAMPIWLSVAAILILFGGWKFFMNFLELRAIPAGPRGVTETVVAMQLRHRKRETVHVKLCKWGFLLGIGLGILVWRLVI